MKPRISNSRPHHIEAYYRALDAHEITWGEPLTIRDGKRTHVIVPTNDRDKRQ